MASKTIQQFNNPTIQQSSNQTIKQSNNPTIQQNLKIMRNKNRFLPIGILTCLLAFYLPCSAQESNQLYVGNLSSFMNEAELKALFVEFGTVTGVMVAIEKSSQRGRGFGVVTMSTPEAAAKAIKAKNGALVNGKNLIVRLLVTQEERSGGSRHGSGRTFRY